MRIIWDADNNRFLAELTPGFEWRNDKDAIQAAGFQTDGPPNWTWFTKKASVLNKLRENRPNSGLSLTEVALTQYNRINAQEEEKVALKKQFEQAKKKAKKESSKKDENEYFFDEELHIQCIVCRPGGNVLYTKYEPPEPPKERCMICDDPLYFYEYKNICIWCKIELDTVSKI